MAPRRAKHPPNAVQCQPAGKAAQASGGMGRRTRCGIAPLARRQAVGNIRGRTGGDGTEGQWPRGESQGRATARRRAHSGNLCALRQEHRSHLRVRRPRACELPGAHGADDGTLPLPRGGRRRHGAGLRLCGPPSRRAKPTTGRARRRCTSTRTHGGAAGAGGSTAALGERLREMGVTNPLRLRGAPRVARRVSGRKKPGIPCPHGLRARGRVPRVRAQVRPMVQRGLDGEGHRATCGMPATRRVPRSLTRQGRPTRRPGLGCRP